jgi:sec-independent protein translocase protein TatB
MFDIGWTEILMIAVIAIVVFPTKDLPRLLRTTGQMIGRLRRMAGDFQSQFNSALREAEREVDLADTRKKVEDLKGLNPVTDLKKALNPLRAAGEDIKRELTGNGSSKRVASQFVPPAAGVAAKAVADPAKVDVPPPGVVPSKPPKIEAPRVDEKSAGGASTKQKPMNVPASPVVREREKVEAAPRKTPKPRTTGTARPNGDSSAAPPPAKPRPRPSRAKPIAPADPQSPPAGGDPSSDGGSR